jgi:bidirectional [NiFe] hydrogenase diaphorase subunit
MGTACYVRGAAEIVEALRVEIAIEPGQVSADGRLSLISARCLGSCGLAPVVVIDKEVLGRETPATVRARVRELVSVCRPEAGSPESAAPPLERKETS